MRIVYNDPIAEAKILINRALQYANVSHIAVTASELRSILDHPDGDEIFPAYFRRKHDQLSAIRAELNDLRTWVDDDSMPADEKQRHFDRMDELQEKEDQLNKHLPKVIEENKITFRVTMN